MELMIVFFFNWTRNKRSSKYKSELLISAALLLGWEERESLDYERKELVFMFTLQLQLLFVWDYISISSNQQKLKVEDWREKKKNRFYSYDDIWLFAIRRRSCSADLRSSAIKTLSRKFEVNFPRQIISFSLAHACCSSLRLARGDLCNSARESTSYWFVN